MPCKPAQSEVDDSIGRSSLLAAWSAAVYVARTRMGG
jgi:hypothetical protein